MACELIRQIDDRDLATKVGALFCEFARRTFFNRLLKSTAVYSHAKTSLQAGGQRAGRSVRWSDEDLPYLRENATECQYILPELEQDTVRTHSAYNNAAFLVTGSQPEFGYVRTLNPGSGRFYNDSDEKEARRVAFLGTDAAKQLFPDGGAVGQTIHLNDFPYTVIGVMLGYNLVHGSWIRRWSQTGTAACKSSVLTGERVRRWAGT